MDGALGPTVEVGGGQVYMKNFSIHVAEEGRQIKGGLAKGHSLKDQIKG